MTPDQILAAAVHEVVLAEIDRIKTEAAAKMIADLDAVLHQMAEVTILRIREMVEQGLI